MICRNIINITIILRIVGVSFCSLIIFLLNIEAQSLNEIEIRYEELRRNLSRERLQLDSLYKSLEDRTKQIEVEKSKIKPDEDNIVKLMAGSVISSKSVELKQTSISKLEIEIEGVRQKLYSLYTYQIDSLKALKRQNQKSMATDEIDRQMLVIIGKRLSITPPVKQLSFVPEKIIGVDLKKSYDSLQLKIYREYLDNALAEVDSLLNQVIQTCDEISQVLRLQNKMNKFIEGVEFASPINPIGTKTTSSATTDRTGVLFNDGGKEFSSSLQSYVTLNNQLSFNRRGNFRESVDKHFKVRSENMSLKDYLELLNELKLRLTDYRIILSEKLKAD